MNKVIVAEFVEDWVGPYSDRGEGIPVVIVSNHPEYKPGTRLDYGFLHVALAQGYNILLMATGRQMSKVELEIFKEAPPLDLCAES